LHKTNPKSGAKRSEIDRLHYERSLWEEGQHLLMGLDEVGRGCLAGPVVAAGVVFNRNTPFEEGLRDSKQMKESERIYWSDWIKEHALFYHIEYAMQAEVDRLNVLKASIAAMLRCVDQAISEGFTPDHLLVDGNRFAASLIPHTCIVKGDDKSLSIAAASVLAKVERDTYMKKLHLKFPNYGWDTNVGYPTKEHRAGIATHGLCVHHRKSFRLKAER
jgi:ribonuclease HII